MKKILLSMMLFAGFTLAPAQEMIQGGDMEDGSSWTIVDLSSNGFDPSTITFGYTDDSPEGGKGGCLSVAAYGVTRNFIYQKVTLTKGHQYRLSAFLKDASDTSQPIQNYWVEVNLVKTEPKLSNFNGKTGTDIDFGAGNYDYQLGMHYWKNINGVAYDRLTAYNGPINKTLPFVWIHCGQNNTDSVITNPRDEAFTTANGDVIDFTLPDTVSTTEWYVLIKIGAFMTAGAETPAYNWLIDELSLWDLAETPANSIGKSSGNAIEVYPTVITDGTLNIKSNSDAQIKYNVYNTVGMLVKSGKTKNTINLGNLSKGLYMVTLENGLSNEQHKIVIK